MRHLKDCPATDGFGCRCNDIRGRPSWQKRYGPREKRKIHVPPLPVLAQRMTATMRDYKIVWTKEFSNWCMNYTAYFVALGKDMPSGPYMCWHNRACRMARETIEAEYETK